MTSFATTEDKYTRSTTPLENDRGVALIVVLVVLLLLSILGATILSSSTADLQIAGNYRTSQEVLYTADAAVEFGQSNANIFTAILSATRGTPNATWPVPGQGIILASGAPSADRNFNVLQVGTNTAQVRAEYVASVAPLSTGDDGMEFKMKYVVITAIGTAANNAETEVEAEVARKVATVSSYDE